MERLTKAIEEQARARHPFQDRDSASFLNPVELKLKTVGEPAWYRCRPGC